MNEADRTIEDAREHFDRGHSELAAGRPSKASRAFREANAAAALVWRDAGVDAASRELSARLCADAAWLAGSHALQVEPAMRAAVLTGVEIYERDDLPACRDYAPLAARGANVPQAGELTT